MGEWIISWNRFIKKYPNFKHNDSIKEELAIITTEFINGPYEFDFNTNILNPKMKKVFLNFLSNANKTDKATQEYEIVKKCYQI